MEELASPKKACGVDVIRDWPSRCVRVNFVARQDCGGVRVPQRRYAMERLRDQRRLPRRPDAAFDGLQQ